LSFVPTEPAKAVAELLTRPLLRGWLHLVCFFLAIPAALLVVWQADAGKARVGAVVYGIGLVALFGVSGAYHRGPWSQAARRRMQQLDHATIFVMIAGSMTPLCLVALQGWVAPVMLVAAWLGASLGAVLAFTGGRRSRIARGVLYIGLGWISVVGLPQLLHRLSAGQLVLIGVGGVLYTVGAVFLATKWPDPFPKVFGYHEVWHVLVVAAVVCHFVAIASVVQGQLA
jgi:hemolysin III